MATELITIRVEEVEEGDVVVVDSENKLVVDMRENGRMSGVWLCFADGHDRFYSYNDQIKLVN